jgi:chromosome segregation ATPase
VKAALIYQNMETAHLNEAKALTNLYEQKLALERSKCEGIAKEVEDLKCSYEERVYLLRQQYKTSLQEFSEKVDQEQTQLTQHLEATKHRISESQDSQDRALMDLEMEFERDRMAVNLEYHNRLVSLEKLYRELVAKGEKLKADTQRQEQEINELKTDLERIKEKRSELDKEIKALQHTLECRTSELNDRDETLLRQAERLDTLQISNNELQKNKDIMNFRIDEMSRELQPSRDEIGRLQSELEGNSEEIRTLDRLAKANHRTMQDKAHQIEVLKRKLEDQKAVLIKKRRIIHMFTVDLTEGVAREDITSRANTLKELHDRYVAAHDLEATMKDANETIDEHTRQRKHLQQSVMLLQRQVHQQQEIASKHFTTKSSENSALLTELNRLQKENRTLKKRLESTKTDVDMLESNLKRARQAALDQQIVQASKTPKSLLPPVHHQVMDDWVKEKTRSGEGRSSVSVVDGRGKYLHTGGK